MKSLIPASEKLGLSRAEASEYVGVGVTLFDAMVCDGRMPPPKQMNHRLVWSRPELERWFADLPYALMKVQTPQTNDPYDDVA